MVGHRPVYAKMIWLPEVVLTVSFKRKFYQLTAGSIFTHNVTALDKADPCWISGRPT